MRINGLRIGNLIAPAVIAAGLLTATGAGAQGIIIDQGGVRIAPPMEERVAPPPRWNNRGYDDGAERRAIGPREARRIARSAGIVDAYDVDRRGPVWVVQGADRRGRTISVTISARSGDVIGVDRARRG